jgi:hypothetical protein
MAQRSIRKWTYEMQTRKKWFMVNAKSSCLQIYEYCPVKGLQSPNWRGGFDHIVLADGEGNGFTYGSAHEKSKLKSFSKTCIRRASRRDILYHSHHQSSLNNSFKVSPSVLPTISTLIYQEINHSSCLQSTSSLFSLFLLQLLPQLLLWKRCVVLDTSEFITV